MLLTATDVLVSVPRTWTTRTDPDHGVVVAARARELPLSGFAPDLVVRITSVADDLTTWRAEAVGALAGQLDGFDLEDDDEFDLDDRPVAYHRFSHRLGEFDLIVEQWSWLVDGVGITLTGSVAREDFLDYSEVFERVAGTLGFAKESAA